MIKGKLTEEMQRSFKRALRACSWYRPGRKLGAAVSGGADSVALLTLLSTLRAELGVVISAVHFNHQLRGKASDADEKFVIALAEKYAVTLHIGRADVAARARRDHSNLEDAARRSRYAFFEKLVQQGLVDAVLTAHSMDDQAETVLAHILRGTGLAGLSGIHPVAGCIRRPLLEFRRDSLRQYLRARKQPWREDASNRDTARTRARMRKKLFPLLLKEFNPAAVEHLAALAERALEQSSFVAHLAGQLFPKLVQQDANGARISLAALSDPLALGDSPAVAALQKALLEKIANHIKPGRGQLSARHLASILLLAQNPETGKRLQLPGGVDVLRERSALLFRRRS
ncbi:MAG TPA: tRNA lysidine(34) synthetase TilS [Candidatus Acidoferrum sp.]|nr:tRNA lysidine(34) synthetase TilS [Candidatus Acidoferrum sp.]